MGYKIIVAHGTTKSGFGIRQRKSNGALRPISPCCGRTLEYLSEEDNSGAVKCKSCGGGFSESDFGASLAIDIDPVVTNEAVLDWWVQKVLLEPDAKVKVTE